MFIDEKLIQENQDVINFFNADAMFDELHNFLEKYSYEYVFNRDFKTKEECVLNYCVRSRAVKLAMDACEHYSKAILIKNGYQWDNMKNVGHNLLKAFNLFSDEDKDIIKNTIFFDNGPLNYSLDFSIKPKVFITDQLKTPRLNNNTFEEILLSLSSEKILPNIKSRYPGQALVDYDEKFVISYAYILHELCYKYKRTREFFESESILK